jgi:hypothetical protein
MPFCEFESNGRQYTGKRFIGYYVADILSVRAKCFSAFVWAERALHRSIQLFNVPISTFHILITYDQGRQSWTRIPHIILFVCL